MPDSRAGGQEGTNTHRARKQQSSRLSLKIELNETSNESQRGKDITFFSGESNLLPLGEKQPGSTASPKNLKVTG